MIKNTRSTFYVLTHCESCYNRRGVFTGRINSKLTAKGHKHAIMLSYKLKDKQIDVAFVSPLSRAIQSLKHILKYHPEVKIIIEKNLIERDYGKLSRKNKEKYRKEHPDLFPIYHRSYDIAPPGGESIRQVEDRVLPWLKKIIALAKKSNLNVLIVAHSNSIRPIRRYFEELTVQEMMKMENLRHKIFTYQV